MTAGSSSRGCRAPSPTSSDAAAATSRARSAGAMAGASSSTTSPATSLATAASEPVEGPARPATRAATAPATSGTLTAMGGPPTTGAAREGGGRAGARHRRPGRSPDPSARARPRAAAHVLDVVHPERTVGLLDEHDAVEPSVACEQPAHGEVARPDHRVAVGGRGQQLMLGAGPEPGVGDHERPGAQLRDRLAALPAAQREPPGDLGVVVVGQAEHPGEITPARAGGVERDDPRCRVAGCGARGMGAAGEDGDRRGDDGGAGAALGRPAGDEHRGFPPGRGREAATPSGAARSRTTTRGK